MKRWLEYISKPIMNFCFLRIPYMLINKILNLGLKVNMKKKILVLE